MTAFDIPADTLNRYLLDVNGKKPDHAHWFIAQGFDPADPEVLAGALYRHARRDNLADRASSRKVVSGLRKKMMQHRSIEDRPGYDIQDDPLGPRTRSVFGMSSKRRRKRPSGSVLHASADGALGLDVPAQRRIRAARPVTAYPVGRLQPRG